VGTPRRGDLIARVFGPAMVEMVDLCENEGEGVLLCWHFAHRPAGRVLERKLCSSPALFTGCSEEKCQP
jgi:hypothetical protein